MPLDVAYSVCPHDCASSCTLDVELETPYTIGRVRGSPANDYTAGVVCAKVARYAERVHHPNRLTQPLRRKGPKLANSTLSDFETTVSGSIALSGSGDQAVLFTGSTSSPTFICALSTAGSWQPTADSSTSSALPLGLTDGEHVRRT